MRNRQVHLDFHTSEKIENIGEKFSKAQFQEALKVGHVDSITIFSKCHHGWAYHPSDANEIHPHLSFDLLKAQLEAAHEIGVKAPIYLSAGFDEKYAVRHPEYVQLSEPEQVVDFKDPGYHIVCMNTPYLEYLLNQITEVLERYDGDGIFLDIVGVRHCYCPACRKTMAERGWDVNDEEKVHQLAEEVYANYTRRVRETVDAVKPGHPVFHNTGHITCGRRDMAHMNSHLELESLPTGGWGYDHFPLSAAYARTLGMDYLGMTGKFHGTWGEFGGYKHPNALRYETALSVANGAAVSVGDQLHPSGEMDMATYQSIGEAYREVEALEPWLTKGKYCSEIAILSQEAMKEYYEHPNFNKIGRDFSGNTGATRMLLEGQFTFDVVDHEADLSGYKVLILPDTILLDAYMQKKVRDFVRGGGKVLASGVSGLNCEKTEYCIDFGVKYMGESEYTPDYLRLPENMGGLYAADYIIYAQAQKLALDGGEELVQHIRPYFNRTREHFCSHRHAPSSGETYGAGVVLGKDGIVIPWNIFHEYATCGSLISKVVVHHALNLLLDNQKTVETSLPSRGIVTLADCGEFFRNHLLYVSPMKRGDGVEIVEDILPVHDVKVRIRVGENTIDKVYTAPQKEEIPFVQEGEFVSYHLKKIENHQVVILEKK
ncbi:MAG: beta-galactosidase trimerization domain-containing protein [Clostridia bacterium]|nr:beta-galactosidase trimerization domain-containing protein [Clostridia bacterium]